MEDSSTWRSVINLKYGTEEGSWFPSFPKGCHGVGLWKEISEEGMLLSQHCFVKLGDGIKVRFWEDLLCGEAPLCSSFPSLYDMAGSKGARVAELWVNLGSRGGWNFSFGRLFHDWELEEVQRFLFQKVSTLILVTGFGGKRLKMVASQSKLVLTCWKVEDSNWCL